MDEEWREFKRKFTEDNIDDVEKRIREVFPPEKYERLVKYTAKCWLE
ncbi:hypothetical protein [Nitrosomonas ureae]|nr:hypothetical protein [Nitrosomonas ureae]